MHAVPKAPISPFHVVLYSAYNAVLYHDVGTHIIQIFEIAGSIWNYCLALLAQSKKPVLYILLPAIVVIGYQKPNTRPEMYEVYWEDLQYNCC
jgi:hypothetical protein